MSSDLIRILGTLDLWLIILRYAAPRNNNVNSSNINDQEHHQRFITRSYIEFCTISISILAAVFSPFKLRGSLLTTGEPNWLWSTVITVSTATLSIYLEDKLEQKKSDESWSVILLLIFVKVTSLLQLVRPKRDSSGIFGFFFGRVLGLTNSRYGLFKANNSYVIYISCVLLLGGYSWLEENGKYRNKDGRWRPYNLVLTIWCVLFFAIYSDSSPEQEATTESDQRQPSS